jgi:protein SDA1
MIAALRFLLGYDQAADDEVEEASSSDDEADMSKPTSTSALSREAVYKAYHKGTTSSRRKKQAKLQRVMRSLQKQQRSKSQALDRQSHAPLYHVHDPQVSLVFVCFPGMFYGTVSI